MPNPCDICGADTYLCQVCCNILCGDNEPPEWRPDITGNRQAGNVCPYCLRKLDYINSDPVFPTVRRMLISKGWKNYDLLARFSKGPHRTISYSAISDMILDGKTAEQIVAVVEE